MSRRTWNIVLWAVFVSAVLGSGAVAFKTDGAPAKDMPVVALFSERGGDKITGDGGGFYIHQGTKLDVNNVSISGVDGSLIIAIRAISGRCVNLLFDSCLTDPAVPNPVECPEAYFLDTPEFPVQTAYWFLRTYWKCLYIPHVEPDGTTWTELIRSTTRKDATILNLKTMHIGETVGVSIEMMRFRAPDSPLTPTYDEYQDLYGLNSQVPPGEAGSAIYLLVTATDWDGDGVMDWILKTIPGKLVIKEYDRYLELAQGDLYSMSGGYPCRYGSFAMPFELKIARQ